MTDSKESKHIIANKLIEADITEEMKKSYLAYAMSVIVGRALPDVRDGLKPVHRRILYSMQQMSLYHNKPYKKSARVVGDVLGKFHPHGDSAVYDALVRMAQDFAMNVPLIDGHGNFGSIDGDAPAAMRYTEVRLSKAAERLLEDLDKDTVDFVPNFDGSMQEPIVLPSKIPNLLVNGSVGIAVGMATNIAPHNLNEVVDALKHVIDNRHRLEEISTLELMQFIKGPDFPTAGIIYNAEKLKEIYETGKGVIDIWAKIEREGDHRIVITEIPYMVNKARLVESIAQLVKDGKLDQIKDIRDESNRQGIRVVIDLKKTANPEKVINLLYKHTNLKSAFGILNVALVGLEPKVLSLKEMLWEFIKHRYEVLLRKAKYELKKAEERKHIVDGLIIALRNIDEVVRIIKGSKDRQEAKDNLMQRFALTEIQANAILDMQLVRLTNLETSKLLEELKELEKKIAELKAFIADENKIYAKIKQDLDEVKQEFGWERRTKIYASSPGYSLEEKDENTYVIIYTKQGYIKKIPIKEFRIQRRGGKGVSGISLNEGDEILGLLVLKGYERLILISSKGKAYTLGLQEIEISSRTAKGKTFYSYLEKLEEDEHIIKAIKQPLDNVEGLSIVMLTNTGYIKATPAEAFKNIRRTGIKAINLKDGEQVVDAVMLNRKEYKYLLLATKDGRGLLFDHNYVRDMGRAARGVKGINVKDSEALKALPLKEESKFLTITEKGYGKQTSASEINAKGRGGMGVRIVALKDDDKLAAVREIKPSHKAIVVLNSKGIAILIDLNEVPTLSRSARGVRIIRLQEGEKVVAAYPITKLDEDAEELED